MHLVYLLYMLTLCSLLHEHLLQLHALASGNSSTAIKPCWLAYAVLNCEGCGPGCKIKKGLHDNRKVCKGNDKPLASLRLKQRQGSGTVLTLDAGPEACYFMQDEAEARVQYCVSLNADPQPCDLLAG